MKTLEQGITYAPDERGGGSSDEEGSEQQVPERVRVGDEEIPLSDLIATYENKSKFERANHERAAEAKRELESARAERRAIEEARQRQAAEHQAFLGALNRTTNPPPTVPREPQLVDMLKEVDPVGDEQWHPKLANAQETRDRQREARFQAELDRKTRDLESRFETKLRTTTATLEQREARERARQTADQHNRTVFEKRLNSEYADIVERLNDDQREEVFEAMKTQIGKDVGSLGPDGQWRWNERAVDNAIWMAEPTRKLMRARETANARVDGLTARRRGEEASRSTPSRVQRRTASSSDDALAAKYESVMGQLQAGQLTPQEAVSRFSAEERRKIAPSFARMQRPA
jgi:hypothetical protein